MKKRIIVSAVLLPIFFAVLFIFPPYVLAIVISLISAIAAYELLYAVKIRNKRVIVYTIVAAVLTPMAVYSSNTLHISTSGDFSLMTLITLLFSIFFIFICLLIIDAALTFKIGKQDKNSGNDNKPAAGRSNPGKNPDVDRSGSSETQDDSESQKKLKFRQIPIAVAAGIIIPCMLSTLIGLKIMDYGYLFVLLPIVAAFLTDSGAYFTGVAIGKRKAFPNISPNKTVEGCIGGILTGTAGIMIYGIILANTTPLTIIYQYFIIYGITGAIVTELGDLFFSLIKRKCRVKDYGRIIPGHGGMLDRFDSMIFTAPAMYLLVILIPAMVLPAIA